MTRAFVAPEIAELKPYEPGKPIEEVERELGVKDALKLASNENAWGPSPRAIEAARGALAKLALYPDAASYKLRSAIAAHHGVSLAEVVVGNGSNEIINMLARALVPPGESIASSAGSFIAYRIAARSHGRRYVESPLGADLGYDLDALLAACDETTKLVFVANPNNPTGTLIGEAALRDFLTRLDAKVPGVVVALDEAYIDFADRPDAPDGLAIYRSRPRTVLLRTFSKAYGLAALRVGYAICEPDVADYLNRVRDPFNLNVVGQAAAQAALEDQAWLADVVRRSNLSRAELTLGLQALGLAVVPSQTNFVLCDVRRDARAMNDQLMRRGVICRPMAPAGLPRHLRITVGLPEQNARALTALQAILAG